MAPRLVNPALFNVMSLFLMTTIIENENDFIRLFQADYCAVLMKILRCCL